MAHDEASPLSRIGAHVFLLGWMLTIASYGRQTGELWPYVALGSSAVRSLDSTRAATRGPCTDAADGARARRRGVALSPAPVSFTLMRRLGSASPQFFVVLNLFTPVLTIAFWGKENFAALETRKAGLQAHCASSSAGTGRWWDPLLEGAPGGIGVGARGRDVANQNRRSRPTPRRPPEPPSSEDVVGGGDARRSHRVSLCVPVSVCLSVCGAGCNLVVSLVHGVLASVTSYTAMIKHFDVATSWADVRLYHAAPGGDEWARFTGGLTIGYLFVDMWDAIRTGQVVSKWQTMAHHIMMATGLGFVVVNVRERNTEEGGRSRW